MTWDESSMKKNVARKSKILNCSIWSTTLHATPVLCTNAIAAVDCSSELSSCQHSDFITCHSANSAIYLPQIKHRLAHFTGTRTHKTQQQTFLPPNSHVFFQMFIVRRSLSIGIGKIIIINDWIMVSFQALQYFRLITIKEIMTFPLSDKLTDRQEIQWHK